MPPVKIASGGGATALPRSLDTSPRELKTQEGTRVAPRIPIGTKTLRSTRRSLVSGNRQVSGANGERVDGHREVVRLGRRIKPLKREPWTRQRSEIDAQGTERSKPSRACETLRAERSRARDARYMWTLRVGVVMRDGNPTEGARGDSSR